MIVSMFATAATTMTAGEFFVQGVTTAIVAMSVVKTGRKVRVKL